MTTADAFSMNSVISESVNLATMMSPSSNLCSSSFLVEPITTFPDTDLAPIPVPDVIISPIT